MKYLLLFSLFCTLFFSCGKTYTCQCVDSATNLGTRSFEVDGNDAEADAECKAAADSTEECFISE